jgi:hypothetical protein
MKCISENFGGIPLASEYNLEIQGWDLKGQSGPTSL